MGTIQFTSYLKRPVDIVYTWVNGNDPLWQAKKIAILKSAQTKKLHNNSLSKCRFVCNDELRFSLRSIEKYAPWVRNIYLVTDKQIPSWINTARVNLVSHEDIFPDYASLPTFNSHSIALCLHRIEGLAEHFIYLNDDVMFSNHARANDFFTKDGKPIYWVVPKKYKYIKKLLSRDLNNLKPSVAVYVNAHRLILDRFGRTNPFRIRHLPVPLTRSLVHSIWNDFPERIRQTLLQPFRTSNDVSVGSLGPLYATVKGIGKTRPLTGIHHVFDRACGRVRCISSNLGDPDYLKKTDNILRLRPLTFCLNDCEAASASDRDILRHVLETLFPKKSSFEL